MALHDDVVAIADSFNKAIFLGTYEKMIDIVNEIAYFNYIGENDKCKQLVAKFNKMEYNIENPQYIKVEGMIDAYSVMERYNGDICLDVEYILKQIGYADTSIKKLIKEYDDSEGLEGNQYVLAVLETIPLRSKYRKGANVFISKLKEGDK